MTSPIPERGLTAEEHAALASSLAARLDPDRRDSSTLWLTVAAAAQAHAAAAAALRANPALAFALSGLPPCGATVRDARGAGSGSWCSRRVGPCPYPGAAHGYVTVVTTGERRYTPCAATGDLLAHEDDDHG
jgi:hypothetical protein